LSVALLVECGLKILRAHVSAWANVRYHYLKSKRAFSHILTADLLSTERQGAAVHLERLNALDELRDFLGGQVLPLLVDLPFGVIFFIVMATINPLLSLLFVGVMGAMLFFSRGQTGNLFAIFKKRNVKNQEKINYLIDILEGIHTVKAFGMESQMMRHYEKLQQRMATDDNLVAAIHAEQARFGSMMTHMNVVVLASVALFFVMAHGMTFGELAACIVLAARIMIPYSKAMVLYGRLQAIRIARMHENEILNLPQESAYPHNHFEIEKGKIDIHNLGFRFSKAEPWVFRNINLTVAPGEIIAITSETQSGKSTLLALLAGLYEPEEGDIRIDNVDIMYINKMAYREKIGYIPQNGVLFQGNVLDNMTGFQEAEISSKTLALSTALGLDDIIQTLPYGYETVLGQTAVDSVSRGIKQRIVIARAFINQPKIVLFDEGNAAMDSKSDTKLKQFILENKGKWTCIMVTHRPSMIALADRVYHLSAEGLRELSPTLSEVSHAN